MTRKRAIKLIMAADGNGSRTAAAKLLDTVKKNRKYNNLLAACDVIKDVNRMSVFYFDAETYQRTKAIAERLLKKHGLRGTK